MGAVEESRDMYGAFSAITQRRQKGALFTLVDQSCKWYSDTCGAVLAESATERSGDESFLENLRQRRTPGSGTLSGLTGRFAASRMASRRFGWMQHERAVFVLPNP